MTFPYPSNYGFILVISTVSWLWDYTAFSWSAITQLGAPEAPVGIFVSAQTVGAILSNLAWGSVGDRLGNHVILRASSAIAWMVPTIALAAPQIAGAYGTSLGTWAFVPIFPLIGAATNGDFIGNWGYMLEIAPDDKQSTYVGFTNTFGAFMVLLPVIGGVLADLASYQAVFSTSAVLLGLTNALAWHLHNLRMV